MFTKVMLHSFVWLFVPINNQVIETVFENSVENFPLHNLEFECQTKEFFVGGKNVLYKFKEGEQIPSLTEYTGPEQNCLEGLPQEEVEAFCGEDYSTVMVVTPDGLITCSTLRGGLCVKRNKTSLEFIPTSTHIRLVANGGHAIGIFLSVTDRGNYERTHHIVLFAKQYTDIPLPLTKLKESAIFSVSPNLSTKVMADTNLGNIFDMFIKGSKTQKMDYRVVLENTKFVFLLLNQNSKSRLVKICKSVDSSSPKKVYEDIPIMCNTAGTNLTHVEHGSFVSVSGERLLVILFSNLATGRSSLCVFDERKIYQTFLESRKHRFGCPKHDLQKTDLVFEGDLTYFNRPDCIPLPLNKTDEPFPGLYEAFNQGDYCNDVDSRISQFGTVIGLLPLTGQAVYTTKSHRGTVIGSAFIYGVLNIYIGTNKGYVIQVLYDPDKKTAMQLREIRIDGSEIRAVKNGNDATYIMSQVKIVKTILKNCSQYPDMCRHCVDARNSNCGLGADEGGIIVRESGVCFHLCFKHYMHTAPGEQEDKTDFLLPTILSAILGIGIILIIILFFCTRRNSTHIKTSSFYMGPMNSGGSGHNYNTITRNQEEENYSSISYDVFGHNTNDAAVVH